MTPGLSSLSKNVWAKAKLFSENLLFLHELFYLCAQIIGRTMTNAAISMTSLLDFIHSMSLSASNKQWLADHLYEEAKQERAVKLPHITKDDLTIDPAVDNLFNAITQALTMPLYDTGEGISIEKLAASKGVTIPASDYGSLIELASAVVAMHYYGNENIPSGSNPECEILIKGLNTGLEYVLTSSGRAGVNAILKIISAEIPSDELSPLFTLFAAGKENSYTAAEKTLYPLLDKFAVDSGLPDRDVYLES